MTEQITVSRELLRQVLDAMNETNFDEPWYESKRALMAALEQPAVEPVAWAYLFEDDGSLCQTFDTQDEAEKWAGSDDNLWSGYIAPLFTAPKAQQPPCIGSGVTVEQTLEQWEHDFSNPMTPEQRADWVKRERDFATRQAQQPSKAVKLTDEEIEELVAANAGYGNNFNRVARAIEQAVWEKLGVTE